MAAGALRNLVSRAQDLTSSGSSGDFNKLSGGASAKKIFDYFVRRGMSPAQAAGFVGVFQKESGFSTTVGNRRGSGATGLAQWLGGRLVALKNKPNWTSLLTQLNFVWEELTGSERGALGPIKRTRTPEQAAAVIDRLYERSDGLLSAPQYARAAFNKFGKRKYSMGGELPGREGEAQDITATPGSGS
jgi:hypothetical protein